MGTGPPPEQPSDQSVADEVRSLVASDDLAEALAVMAGVERYQQFAIGQSQRLSHADDQNRQGLWARADYVVERTRIANAILQRLESPLGNHPLFSALPEGKAANLDAIRERSRQYLQSQAQQVPRGQAPPDPGHPDRAIALLQDWLLDDEQQGYLRGNGWMLFYLCAAVYLYQIEGTAGGAALNALRDPDARQPSVVQQHWQELGIANAAEAHILGLITAGYRDLSLEDRQLQRQIPYAGRSISPQFVVACLSLVHELDLEAGRIKALMAPFLPPGFTPTDEHFVFLGIGPHAADKRVINASFVCYSHDVHRALKQHEGRVSAVLAAINRCVNPRFGYTSVDYSIDNQGYEPIDFKFRVETSAALEIFMGNPIYTDQATFLREVVQNALDACQVRLLLERAYAPAISIERKADRQTVVIRDNGIGMDRAWVEKYFLPIGISFYHSEEFVNIRQLDVGFTPISRFGIGILSCFMVAERVHIRTRKANCPGLEMDITDFRNYFSVSVDESIERGTEIALTLKPNMAELDCLGYLREHVKFTRFPIEYVYHDGERSRLAQDPVSLVAQLKTRFWSDAWSRYLEAAIPGLADESSGGCLALGLPGADGAPPNTLEPDVMGSPSSGNPTGATELRVYQDGIFVCNDPTLIPPWMTRNVFGRLNLCGEDRVDISIARDGLLRNDKYGALAQKIGAGLVDLLSQLYQGWQAQYPERAGLHRAMAGFVAGHLRLLPDAPLIDLLRRYYCFAVSGADQSVAAYYYYGELPPPGKLFIDRDAQPAEEYPGHDAIPEAGYFAGPASPFPSGEPDTGPEAGYPDAPAGTLPSSVVIGGGPDFYDDADAPASVLPPDALLVTGVDAQVLALVGRERGYQRAARLPAGRVKRGELRDFLAHVRRARPPEDSGGS